MITTASTLIQGPILVFSVPTEKVWGFQSSSVQYIAFKSYVNLNSLCQCNWLLTNQIINSMIKFLIQNVCHSIYCSLFKEPRIIFITLSNKTYRYTILSSKSNVNIKSQLSLLCNCPLLCSHHALHDDSTCL